MIYTDILPVCGLKLAPERSTLKKLSLVLRPEIKYTKLNDPLCDVHAWRSCCTTILVEVEGIKPKVSGKNEPTQKSFLDEIR